MTNQFFGAWLLLKCLFGAWSSHLSPQGFVERCRGTSSDNLIEERRFFGKGFTYPDQVVG
jgi:hypothetical protein